MSDGGPSLKRSHATSSISVSLEALHDFGDSVKDVQGTLKAENSSIRGYNPPKIKQPQTRSNTSLLKTTSPCL